jgi:hypothetical protein
MKALYFPYTQIDRRQATLIAGHFGPMRLLNPSPETVPAATAALARENLIELGYAASASGAVLTAALRDFQQWAAAQGGGDLATLHRIHQGIPFVDVHSTPRILAELRHAPQPIRRPEAAAKLQRALLFLLMAQELDSCQQALADDLQRTAAREQEMLALLHAGEDQEAAPLPTIGAAASQGDADYMLTERLQAWSRLALASGVSADAAALWLLTDRRPVLDRLLESMPAETVLNRHPLPAASRTVPAAGDWNEWLARAAAAPDLARLPAIPCATSPNEVPAGYLTLLRIPGCTLDACLAALAGEQRPHSAAAEPHPEGASALVGWVATSSPRNP